MLGRLDRVRSAREKTCERKGLVMKLVHWSHKRVTSVTGRHQKPRRQMKPNGFWVSDESRGAYGWRQWCRSEGFRSYGFRYEHRVELADNAKILYLRTPQDIDKFADKYKADTELNQRMAEIGSRWGGASIYDIDWARVAKKYHGIIITPYQWSQRLGRHSWYYSWDCASGCIWNKRAIKSITMVKERKVPHYPSHWERARKRKRDNEKMEELMGELRKSRLGAKYG